MNATSFFSEDQFNQLRKDIQAQKLIDPSTTPYQKKVKINGNSYTLRIHASFYQVGDCSYFCTCWYDYNHAGPYSSRDIGGGSGPSVICSTFDDFCSIINSILRRFPDYKEPVFTPVQLSLW